MKDLLSLILLSYQSEERLKDTTLKTVDYLRKENIQFELIIIDDGSKDRSFEIALALENEIDEVRAYQLSKNFTSPYVQFAGLTLAKGNCIQMMPDDMQKPLDVIVKMYRKWQEGAKIVISHHEVRNDGKINDFFSKSYYKLMNRFSDIKYPPGGANGFSADREVVDLINKNISPRNTSPILEALRLGYDPVFISYTRPSASHQSRWTLKKKLKLAMDNFFSSSNFPIKFITTIGFLTFFFSLVIIIAIVLAKFFGENKLFGFPVQGWATIIVLVSFFNGLVLFSLGIVAEYIWRIFEEVKHRPGYIIKKKENEKQ